MIRLIGILGFVFLCTTYEYQAKKGPTNNPPTHSLIDPQQTYTSYTPKSTDLVISRSQYADQLYAFWLGQCIANWTGLITEMDKIGGAGKEGRVYSRSCRIGGGDEKWG